MGACTSKSEILRNAGEKDAPVEKEVVEVVANNDAVVAEDGEAKQQSLDHNLSKDQEDDNAKDATKPEVVADELTKNNEANFDQEKIVEAEEEVIKQEASEETKNVVSEVIKTEEPTTDKTEDETPKPETSEPIKTEEETPKPETSEPIKTEEETPKPETSEPIKTQEKEEPKPLFKLWF